MGKGAPLGPSPQVLTDWKGELHGRSQWPQSRNVDMVGLVLWSLPYGCAQGIAGLTEYTKRLGACRPLPISSLAATGWPLTLSMPLGLQETANRD